MMADEQHATGDDPRTPGRGRWLRWGSVYVDIEPPPGPNPWTAPGVAGLAAPEPAVAPAEPPRSRRPAVLFALAALAVALLGFLLVAAFARNDRPPVLVVATTTTRPRPAATTTAAPPVAPSTTPGTRPTRPSTAPTTAPGGPSSAPTTAAGPATTTARSGGGGPITIPEGVPPSAAPAAPATTTTVPATTTTSAGPTAFLGVSVEESFEEGVLVIDVLPATGAAASGLLPGDVITAIDATAVRSPDELGAAITAHRPGDSITVTVLRNGTTVTVRATLGTR